MKVILKSFSISENVVSPIKEPELTPKKKRRLSPIGALRRKIELANEGIK